MDNEKVLDKLNGMKQRFTDLKTNHYTEAKDEYCKMTEVLERIIDRIYPEKDATNLKHKLHRHLFIATDKTEAEEQEDFCYDIDLKIHIIEVILEEHELFGFDDFKPVKEKTETETGIKAGIFSYRKKKTSE